MLETGIGVALAGTLLAIAIPVFSRELHASRFVEPASGVARMGSGAVVWAQGRGAADAFPPPAPLTPATVPRGIRVVDAAELWNTPSWRALSFTPGPEGHAHAFAFAFDRTVGANESAFVARAHGDLDGDGVTSTFEVRGAAGETGVSLAPGMYVEAEIE